MHLSKSFNSICDTTSSTEEDSYIDMDVNPTRVFRRRSIASSPEFEFDKLGNKDYSLTSPADELFYKGNLLPLHMPPRIQMVQKLLQATWREEEKSSSSLTSKGVNIFHSCSPTPSEYCHVSGELKRPDEFFSKCPVNSAIDSSNKITCHDFQKDLPSCSITKAWHKRLTLIKRSSFTSRLKASRAYFGSLFNKPVFFAKPNREESMHTNNSNMLYLKDYLNFKVGRRNTFVTIDQKENKKTFGNEDIGHRRSFSDAINTLSTSGTHCRSISSPSFLYSGVAANSFSDRLLKRSSSVNSDAVQGAIAYCKQSQLCSKRSLCEVHIFPFSAASGVASCDI